MEEKSAEWLSPWRHALARHGYRFRKVPVPSDVAYPTARYNPPIHQTSGKAPSGKLADGILHRLPLVFGTLWLRG